MRDKYEVIEELAAANARLNCAQVFYETYEQKYKFYESECEIYMSKVDSLSEELSQITISELTKNKQGDLK